jgi:amino acid adenylation domain-containing protein
LEVDRITLVDLATGKNVLDDLSDIRTGAGAESQGGGQTLHERFARTAAGRPEQIALASDLWQPTYRELDAASNRLAHAVIGGGGATGDRTAILMRHDTPLIGAALGVLKAGRIAVVLNAEDPPARLRDVLADAEATLIVSDAANRALAIEISGSGVATIDFEAASGAGPSHNPNIAVEPDHTAFLIYTSGSTGGARGVMQTHRQALHNVRKHSRAMGLRSDDRIALIAALTGGLGVTNAFFALLNGASLHPFPVMTRGVIGLPEWMRAQRITVFVSTASFFRHFMRSLDGGHRFPQIRVVRLASEPATSEEFKDFRKHFPDDSIMVHTFGSTETGVIACLRLRPADTVAEGRLPIGLPADGVDVALHDEHGNEVGPGETGEIVVRSRAIFAGYWRRDEVTKRRRSIADDGVPVFHSGDLARFTPAGMLEFVGRSDNRIKVRGYRVDLSEIDDALLAVPSVENAVCCAITSAGEDVSILAYVVPSNGRALSAAALRRALRPVLPAYMMPSAFVITDSFPLTPHGKVDRAKLMQIAPPSQATAQSEQPQTPTEATLATIWEDALELPRIGRRDDFFELGGDSLIASVVSARVHDAFGVEIHLGAFADHPTLLALAAHLDDLRRDSRMPPLPAIVRSPRDRPLPMTASQERTWSLSQTPKGSAAHTVARHCRISGNLDVERLEKALNAVVRRHEVLRTTFEVVNGEHLQIVHPPGHLDYAFRDFSAASDAAAEATRFFEQHSQRVFDLRQSPLVAFALVRIRADEHWLLRVCHHIVCDGWSWTLFFREVWSIYGGADSASELGPRGNEMLQIGDYAAWQRQVLRPGSAVFDRTIAWWENLYADSPRAVALPFRRWWRKDGLDPSEGVIRWNLDREASQRLDALADAVRTTFYVTALAVFAAVLADATGKTDVFIGTNVTNRNRSGLRTMLGGITTLVTLRLRCHRHATFRQWLAEVARMVAGVEENAIVPYEMRRRELQRRGVRLPEINVNFIQADSRAAERFGDLDIDWSERHVRVMPWGFAVECERRSEGHRYNTLFDAGLHRPAAVRKFVDRHRRMLERLSGNPDRTVGELLTNLATA